MPDHRRSELKTALGASLLSIVVSALAVAVTELSGLKEAKYAVPLAYICLAAALVALAVLSVRAYIQDLKSAKHDLQISEVIERSVPMLVRFEKREDRLTVYENGDADLEWYFDLAGIPGEPVTKLTFPIYAEGERADDEPWSAITVELIEVDGKDRNIRGALRPLERRLSDIKTRPSLQYALLTVPVELGPGRSSCQVRVRLKLNGVFPLASDLERFYVDIPYLTELLRVVLVAPGQAVREPVEDGFGIEAMSALMEVMDDVESTAQSRRTQHVGDGLMWETRSAKLGYSYRVRFRVE